MNFIIPITNSLSELFEKSSHILEE